MNESRESKNAEQLEELLLLTEEIQEELEQKDQLIVELKTQLSESLTLNEKLNKENRAGNIQALKNDLKLADRALQIEKEKLRSANVTIGECQDKIRCLTQQRDYARIHQKIVEIPVEKPVLYAFIAGIIYWLLLILVVGICVAGTGILVILIEIKVIELYKKNCWDFITLLMILTSAAVIIYFGESIKKTLSVNLLLLFVLSQGVYVGLRCYLKNQLNTKLY